VYVANSEPAIWHRGEDRAVVAMFYDIPSRCGARCAESKLHDMHAGYKTALNLLLTILSGVNYISYAAGEHESALSISYEKLVIDNEIIGSTKQAARGIEVTSESIALEVIKGVGWGENFLSESHTLQYLRDEIFHTKNATTHTYEVWKEKGRKDTQERQKEKVNKS